MGMSDKDPNIIGPENFETREQYEGFLETDRNIAAIFAEGRRKREAALLRLKELGVDPENEGAEQFAAMSDEQLDTELAFHELYGEPQRDDYHELYSPWETELTRRKWAAEDEKARRQSS